MKIKAALLIFLFLSIQLINVHALEIVIRNADSIFEDTLNYSLELSSIATNVSPRVVTEYSNSTYGCYLSNVPTALVNLTGQLPSTRRLIVNCAASTYTLDLFYSQLPVAVIEKVESNNLPKKFRLFQNHPNPFNPTTTIRFDLPKRTFVTLKVYDVVGREVATLVNEDLQCGEYNIVFDAKCLASGVYFYHLVTDGYVKSKKILLLR